MAIQIPNPGTGNALTGDNEYVLWSKVKSNFENTTHAASRLVGESVNNVMQVGAFGIGANQVARITDFYTTLPTGIYGGDGGNSINYPNNNTTSVYLCASRYNMQVMLTMSIGAAEITHYDTTSKTLSSTTRLLTDKSTFIYTTTTAAGANTVIDSTGKFMRSTSSERYKDIIAELELDDAAYQNAMQLAPIVYRSTAEADNPDYHYYSFSAEKLGAYDPAFTLWRETETVTDDEGNVTEQSLDERQAEGINLNAIVAFLHATNIKQDKIIKVQAEAIETLTKRIDAMTAP